MSKEEELFKEELFKMVYDWGRAGIVTDANAPAFKSAITDLQSGPAYTVRDKIMDKYWAEFLLNGLTSETHIESHFWAWFSAKKMGRPYQKLEDWL